MKEKQIELPELCKTHQSLLVHQANYSEDEPWRVLIIAAQIALFQAATTDPATHEKLGDDIENIKSLGCLACYKPDAFGQIVEVAKTHDLGKIKEVGESWVSNSKVGGAP